MREGLEVVDDELLAQLIGGTLDQRAAAGHEDRLRVMRESRSTVARVAPADDVTALAAGLNLLGRGPDGGPVDDVVFVDRWAAAAAMGRGGGF
ncbi:hypothetical protein [Streptomyces sp. CA2R106]|uniref:hypothetical protein n=1 Tax=Streptomyces sp. CA2R106 TaxID=3120153 RepID=UPI003009AB03